MCNDSREPPKAVFFPALHSLWQCGDDGCVSGSVGGGGVEGAGKGGVRMEACGGVSGGW